MRNNRPFYNQSKFPMGAHSNMIPYPSSVSPSYGYSYTPEAAQGGASLPPVPSTMPGTVQGNGIMPPFGRVGAGDPGMPPFGGVGAGGPGMPPFGGVGAGEPGMPPFGRVGAGDAGMPPFGGVGAGEPGMPPTMDPRWGSGPQWITDTTVDTASFMPEAAQGSLSLPPRNGQTASPVLNGVPLRNCRICCDVPSGTGETGTQGQEGSNPFEGVPPQGIPFAFVIWGPFNARGMIYQDRIVVRGYVGTIQLSEEEIRKEGGRFKTSSTDRTSGFRMEAEFWVTGRTLHMSFKTRNIYTGTGGPGTGDRVVLSW